MDVLKHYDVEYNATVTKSTLNVEKNNNAVLKIMMLAWCIHILYVNKYM